jgi:hypothetical protein
MYELSSGDKALIGVFISLGICICCCASYAYYYQFCKASPSEAANLSILTQSIGNSIHAYETPFEKRQREIDERRRILIP